MGMENEKNRAATGEEMSEMKWLLEDVMETGACDFSAQILGKTSA